MCAVLVPPPDSARFDVVGLGEISVDEVVVLGEALRPGGKARALRRERLGGGMVATAMVAARRLGLRAALCGAVGDDEAGRFALAGLGGEGVEVSGVRTLAAATRQALIVIEPDGARTVLHLDDDALTLDEDAVTAGPLAELVTAGRALHLDRSFPQAARAMAKRAREAGRLVSCDLEQRDDHDDALLPLVDVCVVAPEYLRASDDAPGRDPTVLLHELTTPLVELRRRIAPGGIAVVTLGPAGALLATDDVPSLHQPAFPAAPLVDTTACGDTFRAAFLATLLDGAPPPACLRFAAAAAALKCRDLGRRGCPTRSEVVAALARETP